MNIEKVNCPPVEINIGEYIIYADYIKIVGNTYINEQADVSGSNIITNKSIKNTLITLGGKIIADENLTDFIIYAENLIHNKILSDFQYNNISFSSCILKSYSAEYKDSYSAEIKLVFSTSNITEVTDNASQT